MPVDPTPNLVAIAAGQVPTAAEFDTWHDTLDALSNAWTAYTPALTGITLGNGSIVGLYMQAGKKVDFRWALTFGSTTSVTGGVAIGIPVTALDANWAGSAIFFDSSAGARLAGSLNGGTASGQVVASTAQMNATVPFTWAVNDVAKGSGTIEAA